MYFSFQAFHRAINMAVLYRSPRARVCVCTFLFYFAEFIGSKILWRYLPRRGIYFALNSLLPRPITSKLLLLTNELIYLDITT